MIQLGERKSAGFGLESETRIHRKALGTKQISHCRAVTVSINVLGGLLVSIFLSLSEMCSNLELVNESFGL